MRKRRLSALISALCLTATAVTACSGGGGSTQELTAASTAAGETKSQGTAKDGEDAKILPQSSPVMSFLPV